MKNLHSFKRAIKFTCTYITYVVDTMYIHLTMNVNVMYKKLYLPGYVVSTQIIHNQHYNEYFNPTCVIGMMSLWRNVDDDHKSAQTHISNNDMI